MSVDSRPQSASTAERLASRHAQAWLLLVGALAVHGVDEALTDFLGFYNPLVLRIRQVWPWFPMPTFTFGVWLAGLAALVLVLALLHQAVRRGAPGTRLASWVLAVIMLGNGLAHLGGSVLFQRWLPGATSAPLLIIASAHLMRSAWHRQNTDAARRGVV